ELELGLRFTCWDTTLEVPPVKLPSLLVYTAVIEWLPVVFIVYLQVAVPPLRSVEPLSQVIGVAPSLNATLPVGPLGGVPTGLTVAVNVTCWPTSDGLPDEASAVVVA